MSILPLITFACADAFWSSLSIMHQCIYSVSADNETEPAHKQWEKKENHHLRALVCHYIYSYAY